MFDILTATQKTNALGLVSAIETALKDPTRYGPNATLTGQLRLIRNTAGTPIALAVLVAYPITTPSGVPATPTEWAEVAL